MAAPHTIERNGQAEPTDRFTSAHAGQPTGVDRPIRLRRWPSSGQVGIELDISRARTLWLGVMSLCLVQFVDVLGVTVVVTALPAMLADLRAPANAASLISTGYAMFFGGLLMLGARLGDRFGHRRIIITGLAVFAVAAAVGATATSAAMLTAARCLQGAAAAISVPSALRLLTTITTEGPQRRRAIAAWSAAGAAAGASGFVVGGVVTDLVGWRAVFWAYLPLAVLLAAAIGRAVRPDRAVGRPVRLSLASSTAFTAAVMAFVVATTLLPEPGRAAAGALVLGGAAVLAGVFIVQARYGPRPRLVDSPTRRLCCSSLLRSVGRSSGCSISWPSGLGQVSMDCLKLAAGILGAWLTTPHGTGPSIMP
jgi:MFS family permease